MHPLGTTKTPAMPLTTMAGGADRKVAPWKVKVRGGLESISKMYYGHIKNLKNHSLFH